MKKVFTCLFSIFMIFNFVSCHHECPENPRTAEEIVAYMNEHFDGEFVVNEDSDENKSTDSSTVVSMTCTLENGTVFDNVITSDSIQFTGFYNEESFSTNYYSFIYGDQLDEYYFKLMEQYLDKNLKSFTDYKYFNVSTYCSKGHRYVYVDKVINSFDDFLSYCDRNYSQYSVVFFCEKTDDYMTKEPYLTIGAIRYDVKNENSIGGVNFYYDLDYKDNPDELTKDIVNNSTWQKEHQVD